MTSRYMLVAILMMASPMVAAQELTLEPSKDNTLFDPASGEVSNGAGDYFFAGLTNGGESRRALIAFDVTSIPQGATVNEVELHLTMSKTRGGSTPVRLYRVLETWGEGSSDASGSEGGGAQATDGDATWDLRLFPTEPWSTPGGTFVATASAQQNVGGIGDYVWSSAGMVADVQDWVNDQAANNGWIIRGDEATNQSAKRFNTKENSDSSSRPRLVVRYSGVNTSTEDPTGAASTLLAQNHPNPFSGVTTIAFDLERAGTVRLEVFDLLGRKIRSLAEGTFGAGRHELGFDAAGLPNGVYLYKMDAGRQSQTRQMVLLK